MYFLLLLIANCEKQLLRYFHKILSMSKKQAPLKYKNGLMHKQECSKGQVFRLLKQVNTLKVLCTERWRDSQQWGIPRCKPAYSGDKKRNKQKLFIIILLAV